MDNQEKIFEKIKKASRNQESGDFPSMEKVWSRVGEKLDKKVLKKENTLWKKTAIAASFLLLLTVSYELLRPEIQTELPSEKQVVTADSIATQPKAEPALAVEETRPEHPAIKPEAAKILKQQLDEPQPVAIQETVMDDSPAPEQAKETEADYMLKSKKVETQKPARFYKGKIFDAIGVQRKETDASATESVSKSETIIGNTQAPLVVIDGKAITGQEARHINTVAEGVAKVDPDGDKEVVVLNDPLYIINGHYYSETELFGPNPTSPYAPLNQQEIETILVLQGEKAIANYGKRGEKGVVVITTKDRKPATQNAAGRHQTKTSVEKPK